MSRFGAGQCRHQSDSKGVSLLCLRRVGRCDVTHSQTVQCSLHSPMFVRPLGQDHIELKRSKCLAFPCLHLEFTGACVRLRRVLITGNWIIRRRMHHGDFRRKLFWSEWKRSLRKTMEITSKANRLGFPSHQLNKS